MKIEYHKQFRKHYQKRIAHNPALVKRFVERLRTLQIDLDDPSLRNHELMGDKIGYRAFSVTGDIRVVYKIEGEDIRLYDISSHNQVN